MAGRAVAYHRCLSKADPYRQGAGRADASLLEQSADGPFLAIDGKALADGVVESELFGHEKGSFTGAIAYRAGCLSALRVARCSSTRSASWPYFRPSCCACSRRRGAAGRRVEARKVDVRIVTATNRKLRHEVAAGRFRADLYFRLSVIPLKIAPLRDRREDILPLAHHFLAFHSTDAGRPLMLSPEAEEALLNHRWPGNVRELENVIERAVVMSGQETLMPEAFAFDDDASDEDLVQVAGIARAAGIDSAVGANMAAARRPIRTVRSQPRFRKRRAPCKQASTGRRLCESGRHSQPPAETGSTQQPRWASIGRRSIG